MINQILNIATEPCVDKVISNKNIKTRFHRIVEKIPEPCFMIIFDSTDEILLNNSLSRILGYASIMEFKNHASEISGILNSSQIIKLRKAINQKLPGSGVRYRKLSLIRKDGSAILCLTRVEEIFCGFGENKIVLLCVIEKIIDWSEFRNDNVFKDILKHWDNLNETWLILDFSGNILRMKNKSKQIDFKSNSKWGRNNIFDLIAESDSEKLRMRLTQLKDGLKLPPAEYKLAIREDKPYYIKTYCRLETFHNQDVIVSTISDISNYKEAQNELLKKIIEAEENERLRFSSDLHDELGPYLSALKLSLQSFSNQNDKNKQAEIIKTMGLMLNETIDNVKALTRNLAPRKISDQGISETIKDLVFRINQTARVQILFESAGIEDEYNIQFATAIYRIVLELINNGIKHANANEINIRLYFDTEYVNIYYDDDGRGFDVESSLKSSKGIGLRSIINRINHFQGKFDFYKQEPNGTAIQICLPVNY